MSSEITARVKATGGSAANSFDNDAAVIDVTGSGDHRRTSNQSWRPWAVVSGPEGASCRGVLIGSLLTAGMLWTMNSTAATQNTATASGTRISYAPISHSAAQLSTGTGAGSDTGGSPQWLPAVAVGPETSPIPFQDTGAGGRFVHETLFEQQVAEAVSISVQAVLDCTSNLQTEWQPSHYAAAVREHLRYAATRDDRLALSKVLPVGRDWTSFSPRYFPCSGMERYGDGGDGGKWLCNVGVLPSPCLIYSLGSNGQVDFELSMLESTACDIHTFDCTIASLRDLGPRHTFHRICLGDATADGLYMPLPAVMAKLGHTRLDLLKMDIEGFEYPVFSSLHAVAKADWAGSYSVLPNQVSFELHLYKVAQATAATDSVFDIQDRLFQQMLDMGYVLVSRERNAICLVCEEYLFTRLPAACWNSPPVLDVAAARTPAATAAATPAVTQ